MCQPGSIVAARLRMPFWVPFSIVNEPKNSTCCSLPPKPAKGVNPSSCPMLNLSLAPDGCSCAGATTVARQTSRAAKVQAISDRPPLGRFRGKYDMISRTQLIPKLFDIKWLILGPQVGTGQLRLGPTTQVKFDAFVLRKDSIRGDERVASRLSPSARENQ